MNPMSPNGKSRLNLITKSDLSKKLNASLRSISRWVSEGLVPPPRYIGRRPLWPEAEIDQWINEGCPRSQNGK
jgi:predicted DNA-binding transcriptional regulator AlpA